jgi:hypothetical protein
MNPPIRPREDVEFLWENLLDGKLDCSGRGVGIPTGLHTL